MSELANQPQESDAGVLDHQGFLGTEPDLGSADERPETSADETDAGVEATAGDTETAPGSETEQPPSIEDRLQDFTQRELNEYAQRYPNAWKRLTDAATSEDDKHLLLDKIESDKEIARLRAQEEYWNTLQEEPTPEEPPVEPVPPQDPVEVRKAYYGRIANVVNQYVDPQSMHQLGMDVLSGLGVDVSKVNDQTLPPNDRAELQALIQNAPKLGTTLARAATDLFATLMPVFFAEAQEMANPGAQKMFERQMYSMQWENVRNQVDNEGRPLYANLPNYGTPQFRRVMRQAASTIPNFDNIVFKGTNGQPLPPHQQAAEKYGILARIVSGQKVHPAVVAQAVQTGKRLAGQAERKRAAGRALGAGQTTNRAFRGNASEDDPVMAALDAELTRTNVNTRPVSRFVKR